MNALRDIVAAQKSLNEEVKRLRNELQGCMHCRPYDCPAVRTQTLQALERHQ